LGERLLQKALTALSLRVEDIAEKRWKQVFQELKVEGLERLYEDIGLGNQVASLVVRRLISDLPVADSHVIYPLAIQGTEGMVVTYARCCHPIPGDTIIGFLSAGRGIVIHRENCKNVSEISTAPEKYIFIQWADKVEGEFPVELRVDVLSKRGGLATVANVLAENDANIQNVHIDERDHRHNTITFLLSIRDRNHLAKVMRQLRGVEIVTRVIRK
jgi:(p)ppGpp synthase/HD superfamily hydrolase